MSKIEDYAGGGNVALSGSRYDTNISSACGINEAQSGTTHTIDIDDQNKTIEYTSASAKTVTLTLMSTITGALHTNDFKVTLKNTGAGAMTVNCNASDTFDDTSTVGGNSATQIILQDTESVTIQTDSTGGIWNIIIIVKHYEEGVWTPVLSDGSNNATASTAVGTYTKIGRLIIYKGRIIISSLGSVSGATRLTGLPYASSSTANTHSSMYAGSGTGLAITGGEVVSGVVIAGDQFITVQLWDSTAGTTGMIGSEWSADGTLNFGGSYEI